MRRLLTTIALFLTCATSAWAVPRTVVLSVPGMDCATCPITVSKALRKVAGVLQVSVTFVNREARVTFDDAVTTVAALLLATKNAGYPSAVKP